MTAEEIDRAKSSLGGRTACTSKVFKDTLSLLEICKKDSTDVGLGAEGAIALFNVRAGLVILPKPSKSD